MRSSRSSGVSFSTSSTVLALDLVGQQGRAGLADGAAPAGEGDLADTPSVMPSIIVIRSPQSGLEPS